MTQWLSESKPKAIKDHKCNYCAQVINKGTIYKSESLLGDDGFYTWKSHPYCQQLAVKLNMFEDADEGLTGESFREGVNEEYYQIIGDRINSISFKERLEIVLKHHNLCAIFSNKS